ncbi:hypothetical protein J3R83DRAFT_4972 [Lanmaoa asiatica]|nr:hypothetical protein J3R83DRAFT_4972 [Lanmaoa asiatica]
MEHHALSSAILEPPSYSKPQAVPLSTRSHLNRVDEGLHGTTGAQKIISQLTTQRPAITKLTLNHNPLGDDGISHLFNYLCSTPGSRHRIALSEISLNCTAFGCKGLQAISDYIRGNDVLRTLWLASNALLPDPAVFSSLASAINDSRLRFLSLTSNNQLGDAFVGQFLPFLRSRHLHELHINTIGLTARSAPVIGGWISGNPQRNSDGACYLQTFKSSGNSLGVNGFWEIVKAIERGNWGITRVEMYANQLVPSPTLPDTETEVAMKDAERALHRVLMRNSYWKRQTEKEALILLRYSRPLLMRRKSSPITVSLTRPASPPVRTATSLFPFYALPNELKLCILGLLAPSLSSAQRMRICNYASDPSSLPCLLPPLRRDPGKGCLADPSSLLGSSVGFQAISPNGSGAVAVGPSPSPTLGRVEFGDIIAPPSADDPNRPGEPINGGLRVGPMSVNGVLRHDVRKRRHPSEVDYLIDAMWYQYPELPEDVPEGWTACRHPEGALYFIHSESKTFSEVNMCDGVIHDDIESFRTYLFSELETEIRNRNLSEFLKVDEVQLVLEPKLDELGLMCCYYFVNSRTRSLFWLNEWDGYEIFEDCRGILSPPHKGKLQATGPGGLIKQHFEFLGLGIQAHYWCVACVSRHWDLYPNFCKVTHELKAEVVDMILHATCGEYFAGEPTVVYALNNRTTDHLTSNRTLINTLQVESCTHSVRLHHALQRFLFTIADRNYFLNFHGEECARLNFDQSIHGWRYHPSLLMTTFAPLLFMVPVNNVRLLHRIFVDDIASKEKWNMFVKKLNSQLQETSVLATVLLNANVAFLPKQSGTGTSQFLSYMSLVVSMASIILGLVFMGHSRIEARNTPLEVATILNELRHKRHGLETLAVIYSLPRAFLMWGMVFFFAAFAVQWCYPGDTTWRACAGAFMLMVALVVAWCIWTARDRCDFWWFEPDPNQVELEVLEGEEGVGNVSFGLLGSSFLRGLTTSLTRKFKLSKPLPGEIHAMQDTASLHVVLDRPIE